MLLSVPSALFSYGAFLAPHSPRSAEQRGGPVVASAGEPFKVGVLALQGGFKEHLNALERQGSGIVGVDVRSPAEFPEL